MASDFLLQVAKVCRVQAGVARNERDIEEEAKFLLLAEALEEKTAEHPDEQTQLDNGKQTRS